MIPNFGENSFKFAIVAIVVLPGIYPFMKRITYWPQAWLGSYPRSIVGAAHNMEHIIRSRDERRRPHGVAGPRPGSTPIRRGAVRWMLGMDDVVR